MWELIHNVSSSASMMQQLAQMRQQLISIAEKERILRERSADLEAYRYLLDAHRLLASDNGSGGQILKVPSPRTSGGNELAA